MEKEKKVLSKQISDLLDSLIKKLNNIGVFIAFLMSGLMFVDIIMRFMFNKPTRNVYELVQLSMVFIVSLAIGYTEINNSHITMDLITSNLKPRALFCANNALNILNICLYTILLWCTLQYSMRTYSTNIQISGLLWPVYLLNCFIIFGLFLYWLLLIRKFFRDARSKAEGKQGILWAISILAAIVFIVAAIVWSLPDFINVSAPAIGILSVAAMFILMLTGMPVASVLFVISLTSMTHLKGLDAAVSSVGSQMFSNLNNYSWVVICFFILMGYFVSYSDFGADAYNACYKWIGHMKGGLAIATVAACAVMAACVGDQMSSTVTMSTVALPEMKRYKYSDKLSIGSILGGATLGPLIPPSTGFIMYGLLTSTSIGDLFIAGIIPGILLALIFIIYIRVECRIHPEAGPAGEETFSLRDKVYALKSGGPIIFLFIVIIGGIYTGVFTPTEGGAIGAFTTFLIALVMRRLSWEKFKALLRDTGKLVGGLLLVVVSALIFGTLMIWCKIPFVLQEFLTDLHMSNTGIVIFMLIITFILGFFMDSLVIMMITIPIFYPVLKSLGVDLIYFGVLTCTVQGFGALTPPFGVLLFALKGMHKEIPFSTIARAVIPYVVCSILLVALIVIFPPIATWLPYAIRG